ncbi:MAG: ribosome small subunit-dependent GTPase A [Chitinispirillaceae bacterium]|nr:ribosome small subunit-dependent GTPase A [Chitinispirillaceae bacterium]
MLRQGLIIEEQKNYYLVASGSVIVRATRKGTLKKEKKRICTGDRVDVEVTNSDADEGVIVKVHERSTYLNRPPLANIEQVLLVCTFKEPPLDLEATDRFLLCAGAYNLKTVMVFNKSDLITDNNRSSFQNIIAAYQKIGYEVRITSAKEHKGIDELAALCTDTISAFAGLSGVGKSALLAAIFPEKNIVVGEVSGTTGRGTHTTTTVSLLPLPCGGYVADTPGLSYVDLPLIPEEDVVTYFPELERLIGACRFNNCIHEKEPGCKVRQLVDSGEVKQWRVEHYLKIYKEMRERRKQYKDNDRR